MRVTSRKPLLDSLLRRIRDGHRPPPSQRDGLVLGGEPNSATRAREEKNHVAKSRQLVKQPRMALYGLGYYCSSATTVIDETNGLTV